MTRINVIPAKELIDKHLVAEYRELPRLSKAARFPKKNESFPDYYKLGAGHVKFFYDKGAWLQNRFKELVAEMQRRGFTVNYPDYRPHPEGLNNDWKPTEQALKINRERIALRISQMKGG